MKFLTRLTDISNIKRIKFREDINGLRAIAVLVVVFYHADIEIFKGGWLGVDIFFVISGYLISNIIISELNEDTFSFKNFYLRRIRRILPALFSMLLFTIPFAVWLLSPKAMLEYLNSMISSLLFFSNLYFKDLDFYNSAPGELMPLLHTWSLAIEEQYYILFPLFLFILYKYKKKYIFFVLLTLTLGSIYLNTLVQDIEKFYMLQFRIWEILIGALIVFLGNIPKIKHLEKLGFALMLWPILNFNDLWINDIEPKLICLFGLALFILFNEDSTYLSKLINLRFLSRIGLSSYSIYLLHQPVFAFFRINKNLNKTVSFKEVNDSEKLLAYLLIILVVVISQIQYKYVEIRFPQSKYFFKIIILLFLGIFLFVFLGTSTSGYQNRVDYDSPLIYEATMYQNFDRLDLVIDGEICFGTLDKKVEKICTLTKDDNLKHIYVIGDSHSRFLLPVLAKADFNNSITFFTGDSCIFLSNIVNYKCARSDKEALKDKILSIENSIFIYSGSVHDKLYDPKLNLIENIPKTITELAQKNIVIVIEQIPEFPVYISDRILNSGNKEVQEIKFPNYEWSEMISVIQTKNMYSGIDSSSVFFIDSFEIFCNSIEIGYCVGAKTPDLFIFDDNHPTLKGAELIVNQIESILIDINLPR
jgi:peptidoglycan/LPS O-acetylase OafA/YrhL